MADTHTYDAIIIGAGHNGLVAAAYLSKARKKVLVLERRPIVGGIAVSERVIPDFLYPTCAHLAGSLSPRIIADLELTKRGLEILPLDPLLFSPSLDGTPLSIPRDAGSVAEALARHSPKDAQRLPAFTALTQRLSALLAALNDLPLPAGSGYRAGLSEWIKSAWKVLRLDKKELVEFLRVVPMSVADFLDEWFETEALKAALAASALLGSFVGPRAQGTTHGYLHSLSGPPNGAFRTAGLVRGGIGNLSQTIAQAAKDHGAEIRTGAEVAQILTKGGAGTGVVLRNGEEISAAAIISNADIKRTFLKLVEPTYLQPRFLLQVKNIRSRGAAGKINFALDRLPNFNDSSGHSALSNQGGVIYIAPSLDYLERASDAAKYGTISPEPFLEITIPTIGDASLAPPGKHVMSVWMQYAPYHLRNGRWDQQRDRLGDLVVQLIDNYAPGFKDSVLHRQVLTPLDLEQIFGLTEGHIDHGELAMDQLFFMRPVPGWARYRTPIENLYVCGAGTHPGGALSGLSGRNAATAVLKDSKRKKN